MNPEKEKDFFSVSHWKELIKKLSSRNSGQFRYRFLQVQPKWISSLLLSNFKSFFPVISELEKTLEAITNNTEAVARNDFFGKKIESGPSFGLMSQWVTTECFIPVQADWIFWLLDRGWGSSVQRRNLASFLWAGVLTAERLLTVQAYENDSVDIFGWDRIDSSRLDKICAFILKYIDPKEDIRALDVYLGNKRKSFNDYSFDLVALSRAPNYIEMKIKHSAYSQVAGLDFLLIANRAIDIFIAKFSDSFKGDINEKLFSALKDAKTVEGLLDVHKVRAYSLFEDYKKCAPSNPRQLEKTNKIENILKSFDETPPENSMLTALSSRKYLLDSMMFFDRSSWKGAGIEKIDKETLSEWTEKEKIERIVLLGEYFEKTQKELGQMVEIIADISHFQVFLEQKNLPFSDPAKQEKCVESLVLSPSLHPSTPTLAYWGLASIRASVLDPTLVDSVSSEDFTKKILKKSEIISFGLEFSKAFVGLVMSQSWSLSEKSEVLDYFQNILKNNPEYLATSLNNLVDNWVDDNVLDSDISEKTTLLKNEAIANGLTPEWSCSELIEFFKPACFEESLRAPELSAVFEKLPLIKSILELSILERDLKNDLTPSKKIVENIDFKEEEKQLLINLDEHTSMSERSPAPTRKKRL